MNKVFSLIRKIKNRRNKLKDEFDWVIEFKMTTDNLEECLRRFELLVWGLDKNPVLRIKTQKLMVYSSRNIDKIHEGDNSQTWSLEESSGKYFKNTDSGPNFRNIKSEFLE